MAKIGELIINLKANTAAFASDIKKVSDLSFSSAKNIEKSFRVIGGAAMAAFATVKAATYAMAVETAGYGDELVKASQKTGIAVEQLSALRFAADLSDVSFDSLVGGLGKFAKGLAGLQNTTGQQGKAFAALGIETRNADGSIRPMHDLLLSVAERFSKTRDGAEKTAVAMSLFGRGGAALIPLLNEGSAGIGRMEEQAAALGMTFSEKDALAASEFHDSLKVLHAGMLGFEFSVGKKVIPTLTDLSVSLAVLTEQGEYFGKSWLKDFAIGATVSLSALPAVFTDIVTWSDAGSKSLGDWAASASWANRNSDDLTKRILQLREVLKSTGGLGGGAALAIPGGMPKAEKKEKDGAAGALREYAAIARELRPNVDELSSAFDRYADTLIKIAAIAPKVNASELWRLNTVRLEADAMKVLDEQQAKTDAAIRESMPAYPKLFQDVEAAMRHVTPEFDDLIERTKRAAEFGKEFADTLERGLENLMFSGQSFREVLAGITEELGRMILRAAILGPLEDLFKGFFASLVPGGWGALFGLAGGGDVSGGTPYLVGERGPELFVPDVSGSIVPNGKSLGGVVNNYTIDARGADPGVERRIVRALKAVHGSAIQTAQMAMQDRMLRSGA